MAGKEGGLWPVLRQSHVLSFTVAKEVKAQGGILHVPGTGAVPDLYNATGGVPEAAPGTAAAGAGRLRAGGDACASCISRKS